MIHLSDIIILFIEIEFAWYGFQDGVIYLMTFFSFFFFFRCRFFLDVFRSEFSFSTFNLILCRGFQSQNYYYAEKKFGNKIVWQALIESNWIFIFTAVIEIAECFAPRWNWIMTIFLSAWVVFSSHSLTCCWFVLFFEINNKKIPQFRSRAIIFTWTRYTVNYFSSLFSHFRCPLQWCNKKNK